jgi:hypothetical protein
VALVSGVAETRGFSHRPATSTCSAAAGDTVSKGSATLPVVVVPFHYLFSAH